MKNTEYAGFWVRVGAMLIDAVIVMIALLVPLSFIYGEAYWTNTQLIYGFWDLILQYIAPFVATIWFWVRYKATPGKLATKLQVVDATTGDKLRVGQAIGRYFAYILSALPLCLGFIWIAIDKRKQSWHDKLAGTVVIRNTGKESVQFDTNT